MEQTWTTPQYGQQILSPKNQGHENTKTDETGAPRLFNF